MGYRGSEDGKADNESFTSALLRQPLIAYAISGFRLFSSTEYKVEPSACAA
jgi:hypothetical protein